MTRLTVLARERHYADHCAPIWLGLRPEERGRWHTTPPLVSHAVDRLGVPPSAIDLRNVPNAGPPVLVAAHGDMQTFRPRRAILVNHGAGQTYESDRPHPSYTGGARREQVVLYLCPGPADADACRQAQPDVEAVPVGSPRLDRWHPPDPSRDGDPVVVTSWHSDAWQAVPETCSAWGHYGPSFLARVARRWDTVGHCHPRQVPRFRGRYRTFGIPMVEQWADVADLLTSRRSVYVVDNSSTGVEAASMGVPVVWLNSPDYRRHVDHGGRFWDWCGHMPCVDGPAEAIDAIAAALDDPDGAVASARPVVQSVYDGLCDGTATQRAVQAVRRIMQER